MEIKSYDTLSIGKYYEVLQAIESITDRDDLNVELISILTGKDVDDVLNMPITAFKERLTDLSFLLEAPQPSKIKMSYKLNKTVYDVVSDLTKLTASQYIDYQTFIKDGDKHLVELISVFLIPDGKSYGDYDISKVHEDIREHLSIADAMALSAFFLTLSKSYIESTVTCLKRRMKRMRRKAKTQEEKERLTEIIADLETGGVMWHLLTKYQRLQDTIGEKC